MADNITSPVPSGTILGTDQVGSVHYPRSKLVFGIDGAVTDASATNPLPVTVSNLPATQPVSGSISVANFPTTQPVSGSVGVSNFPTSFSVSNFPATQPVSGSVGVSNFPTSFSVSNFPATQPVSGSVNVSNFPATQSSYTPDTLSTGNTIALATLNSAYTVNVSNGQNVITMTMSGLSGSGATLILEGSNDGGTTWVNVYSVSGSTGIISNTFTADGSFSANVGGRTKVRLRTSVVGTGSCTIASNLSVAVREVRLDTPLPPGTNSIGTVSLTPGATATLGIGGITVGSASSNLLKSSAGNCYSINGTSAGTAGYAILYNSATVLTSGGTITPGSILWAGYVPANSTFDKNFAVPQRGSTGLVLLFSTSLTTFTTPANVPALLSGQVA